MGPGGSDAGPGHGSFETLFTIGRLLFILGGAACLAMGVLHVRLEQSRTARGTRNHESRILALRSEFWELQVRRARLRAPDRIRQRAEWLAEELRAPGERRPGRSDRRLALTP